MLGGPGGTGSPYGFMCYLLRAPEVLLNVRNHHLALLIVFWRFYYSICLGGLGGLQHPMWSLLRASMVLLKVREHLYLTLWWFSKGFVTLTFKNFHFCAWGPWGPSASYRGPSECTRVLLKVRGHFLFTLWSFPEGSVIQFLKVPNHCEWGALGGRNFWTKNAILMPFQI